MKSHASVAEVQQVRDLLRSLHAIVEQLDDATSRILDVSTAEWPSSLTEHLPLLVRQRLAYYLPPHTKILFVTIQTHADPELDRYYYRASSHLFRCLRAAFVAAGHDGSVPTGEAFLDRFRDSGCSVLYLPKRTRQPKGRPRSTSIESPSAAIASAVASLRPTYLVGVKRPIRAPVLRAARLAGLEPANVHTLETPSDLWRTPFSDVLAGMLGLNQLEPTGHPDEPLIRAISNVLNQGGGRLTAKRIAESLERAGSPGVPKSRISFLARSRPDVFHIGPAGIRLITPGSDAVDQGTIATTGSTVVAAGSKPA